MLQKTALSGEKKKKNRDWFYGMMNFQVEDFFFYKNLFCWKFFSFI